MVEGWLADEKMCQSYQNNKYRGKPQWVYVNLMLLFNKLLGTTLGRKTENHISNLGHYVIVYVCLWFCDGCLNLLLSDWWCPLLFICVEDLAFWTRLRDLIITISDTPDDYDQTENICRIIQGYVFDDDTERIRYFDCVAQKAGRYVRLINSPNTSNCFHLGEVEIFGYWDNQDNWFIEQN